MSILFERAWNILSKNRRQYLVLSGLYYGVLLALMLYAVFDSPFQSQILESNRWLFMTGALAHNGKTAVDLQVLQELGRSFLFNVLGASYGGITMPSFVLPFIGVFLGLYRAALVGVVFSPFNAEINQLILMHIPTIFLEGQAIILTMLGAYIQGMAMIWPTSIGHTSRWKAYVEAVRQTGTLYIFIMAIFLLSALYGVIEVAVLIG